MAGSHRASLRPFVAWTAILATVAACAAGPSAPSNQVSEGSVAAGKTALQSYGCGSCHTIPGVVGADGLVGPPLDRFGRRAYIAGRLGNNHDNLVDWIRNPQDVDPRTAMPNLGVNEDDAVNMAAYLLSLD